MSKIDKSTHKGEWLCIGKQSQPCISNKIKELSEEENIDPQLSMLPAEYQTGPGSSTSSETFIQARSNKGGDILCCFIASILSVLFLATSILYRNDNESIYIV